MVKINLYSKKTWTSILILIQKFFQITIILNLYVLQRKINLAFYDFPY